MEQKKTEISKKKYNAQLYPIYKMCSADLLFYYAISTIFLIQIKGLSIADVMFADAMCPLFKLIFQLPSLTIIDKIGKRRSLILANSFLTVSLIFLIFATGIEMVILSYLIMGFSLSIKNVAESNLLFDSVPDKKGNGIFSKIEEKGLRNYYYLDGITSIATGFLFMVNGYLPMLISMGFTIIGTALATCFKEVYQEKPSSQKTLSNRVIEYLGQLKSAFEFIFKSHRLQAIIVFALFFEGILWIAYTIREGLLLTELGVSPQIFAIILSVLTIISGITAKTQGWIHKKFKNKALTFISLPYMLSFIAIGVVSLMGLDRNLTIIIIIGIYALQYGLQAPYNVLMCKYLKSFASPSMRVKIAIAYDFVKNMTEFIFSLIASYLLARVNPSMTFLTFGISITIIISIILIWMKKRFGLRPEEYKKEDIQYKIKEVN